MRQTRDRAAQGQYGGELRELRRLDAHGAEVEPPPCTVYLGSDPRDEHEHEAGPHDQVHGRGIPAPGCVTNSARRDESGDAEDHVPDAYQEIVGPDLPVCCRVDHDESQQGEAERHEEQVRPQTTHRPTAPRCPASSPANLTNASPLSAYPGNWSKLAHPGESSTTSPGCASSVALSTAFSRSVAVWTRSWKPSTSRYAAMRGPNSPWHTTARHVLSPGSNSEKSVPFSEPPRMRTTGTSRLARAAATAAGLVALESSM